ncbi:MAG: hypothetical protein KA450_03925 [Bacteroidia bacterium]|nr:hypothetical protein [Bacteroidia bacterium]
MVKLDNVLKYKNPLDEIIILNGKSDFGIYNISTGELRSDFFSKIKKTIEDPAFIILKENVYYFIRPFFSGRIVYTIKVSKAVNDLCIDSVSTNTETDELKKLIQENEQVYVKLDF